MSRWTLVFVKVHTLSHNLHVAPFSPADLAFRMADKSQRLKRRDGILSSLNAVVDGLNLAEELSSITPAKAVFGSVSALLTVIRVSFLPAHFSRFLANMYRIQ